MKAVANSSLIIALCLLLALPVVAQKARVVKSSGKRPVWYNNEHALDSKRSNDTYEFIMNRTSGSSLSQLREKRVFNLAEKIGEKNQITKEAGRVITNEQGRDGGSVVKFTEGSQSNRVTDVFYTCFVDDYWELLDNGDYEYSALFAVSKDEHAQFDVYQTSTSYGITPALMSIVPGVGQMYKGSYLKGGLLLGGTAVLGLGALLCENQRSDYHNKTVEQPKFAKQYNTKANNWQTARNVCLGAAAAVWVYNIVDAATAKGARRIIVKPGSRGLSMQPVLSPEANGLALTYSF